MHGYFKAIKFRDFYITNGILLGNLNDSELLEYGIHGAL